MIREEFDFSNNFQDLILACLIRHPDKFYRFGTIIKSKYFMGVQATIVARSAIEYFEKYGRFPGWEALEQVCLNELEEKDQEDRGKEMQDYIGKLAELSTNDVEFVTNQVVTFVKERATIAAVQTTINEIKEGKIQLGLLKRFEDIFHIGQNLDDLGLVLHQDAAETVRKVTSSTFGIKTGFPLLDGVWKNGLAPGWLIALLAPPKRFKTTFALKFALNAVGPSVAADVIYYACEISQEFALCKCLYNIARMTNNEMYEDPENFIRRAEDNMKLEIAGNLIYKGYPSKTATISDMKAHAKTCISQLGIKPKLIVIDYAETVKSSIPDAKDYIQSASIFTEARAFGQELGCAVVMPDRCNKETVSLAVPNMKSFQGSFEKSGVVDAAIGLCSTDAEYLNNIIRYFIFLNRHGPAFQHFRGKVDPEYSDMTMDEQIEYEPEEDSAPRRKKDGPATNLPPELQE